MQLILSFSINQSPREGQATSRYYRRKWKKKTNRYADDVALVGNVAKSSFFAHAMGSRAQPAMQKPETASPSQCIFRYLTNV
jgi:hypothetical protein